MMMMLPKYQFSPPWRPPDLSSLTDLEGVLLAERVEALDEALQRRPEAVLQPVRPQLAQVALELLQVLC